MRRSAPVRSLGIQPGRSETFSGRLRVSDVLGFHSFSGSAVIAGEVGLDRPVHRVNVMQVPTERYAKADELVLAAATAFQGFGGEVASLVQALDDRGVAALAVRGAPLRELLGDDSLRAAEQRGLPLVELPGSAHLDALQEEVLQTIVAAQATQLKVAAEVRDRLADLILAGAGLNGLPDAIAEILGGDVTLVASDGVLLAASREADLEEATAAAAPWLADAWREPAMVGAWVVWPVLAGARVLGCLTARMAGGSGVRDAVQVAALQHGAENAALQMLHRQEAADAGARFRAGFVRDLLSGSLDHASAVRRAAAVGWRPDGEFVALLAEPPPGVRATLLEETRSLAPEALVTAHVDACLAALPVGPDAPSGSDGGSDLDVFLIDRFLRVHEDVHVGVSDRHAGLEALPAALAEAEDALRAARVFDRRTRVRRFPELGLLRLLVDVPVEELRRLRRVTLAPLDALQPSYRSALRETLELLVACGLNVAETARRGGWHYNTVRSRVARLTDLLGPLVDDGATLDSVSVALVLDRELGPGTAP